MTQESRTLLVGAGPVGIFYASRLPGVSVVCRSNYAAVKEAGGGFALQTRDFGEYTYVPSAIYASLAEAVDSGTPFDTVIVATKALGCVSLKGLSPSAIVLIQNGVGIEEAYAKAYPFATILSAVTAVSASQPYPGKIIQHRWTRLQVGPYSSSFSGDSQAQRFVQLLKQGGIKDASAHSASELQQLRWHKLAINASFSPTSVLSGGYGNAELALNPVSAKHIRAVMEEIFDTAKQIFGRDFPIECAGIDKILTSTRRNLGAKPSMLIDWESNRPLEIEAILENPIKEAHKHGLSMPRLETLHALLAMRITQRAEEKTHSKL